MRTSFFVFLLLVGCVGTSDPASSFLLAVDDTPIEVEAPGSLLVQLVVIGADGGDLTIEADGLPDFGTLDGTQLTFEPSFEDAGDYTFDLTARSGAETDTATMHVHVTRVNTPPYWVPSMMLDGSTPDTGSYPVLDEPVYSVVVIDEESDAITVEVEVVPAGSASAMVATHSATAEPDLLYYANEETPYAAGAEISVPLTDLPPGRYDFRVRAIDELGLEGPYAWHHFGGFTQP